METIRNYLENMFANLPNSPEVLRAKDELWQMMEDKYNELISEGKSENEAVGTVISEFGNLDEIAADLGLEKEVRQEKAVQEESPRRPVCLDEVKDYLQDEAKAALGIGIGVAFCIMCASWPVLTSAVNIIPDTWGIIPMMAMIIIAVALFIVCGSIRSRWDYLKKDLCSIEYSTATYVHQEKERFHASYIVQLVVGIALCATCWMPVALLDGIIPISFSAVNEFMNTIGVIFLFVICGIGVFLIIHSSMINSSYELLLSLNKRDTVGGNFVPDDTIRYSAPAADGIMSVYWPTIRCVYLIWSFLTFDWYKTWIIWPVAAIVHAFLKSVLRKSEI